MWESYAIGNAAGRYDMVRNIDDVQKLGKDNMDATLKSFGAVSKSLQAITVEIADYSKTVFEASLRRRASSASSIPISPRRLTSRSRATSARSHRPSNVALRRG